MALVLRTFNISGGRHLIIIGFLLLFLHYLMNLFIPLQFDYEIKDSDDVYGSKLGFYKILTYLFKASLALFFLAYMLKAFHFPLGGVVLGTSILFMSPYYLIIPKQRNGTSWIDYFLGISIIISLLAILLKYQHLPFASTFLMLMIPLVTISGIITVIKRNSIRPVIKRTILILFVLVISSFSKYTSSAIRNLTFNYAAFEKQEQQFKLRSILYNEDDKLLTSEAIGLDSLQKIITIFEQTFVQVKDPNYNLINDTAYEIYLDSDDTLLLQSALKWSELTVKHDKNWYWIDTYASLLYKNKKYQEARIYAEEAYELGKDPSTYELIQQIDSVLVVEGKEIKE